jgi:uncharacterized protein
VTPTSLAPRAAIRRPRAASAWTGAVRVFALWLLATWFGLGLAHAQQPLPVPALSGRVIDQTGTLDAAQKAALEARLAAFEAEAGPQIVVLLVPTTAPEDIAAYAQRVGDTWKIGRRDVGDGLLIVVAKNDRRVNIQTAKALEGAVPDLAARQIIDRAIVPAFRAGDYAGGLDAAVQQLIARSRGEGLPAPTRPDRGAANTAPQFQELLILFFIGVPVLGGVLTKMLGRKLGSMATAGAAGTAGWFLTASVLLGLGAAFLALMLVGLFGIGSAARSIGRGGRRGGPPIIFGGGGDHGSWGGGGWGGGGGFGGGGFGSGGGGDFGGGGASGSW